VILRKGAVAAALAALCAVAPTAAAHEGNPNYRSQVRSVSPPVAGLDARVLNFDDRIELTYDGDQQLVVAGYRGEPYLRFEPDGRVQANTRSPAGYLNEDRFAQAEVPERANPRAAPAWRTVARNGRYDWHDHRIHWMSEGTLPSRVEERSRRVKVFDWQIPVEAGGRESEVRGTLTWVGEPDGGFPLAAALSLAAVGLGGGALVALVRRRRRRPARAEDREAW
jgi:hypothetical protein